MFIFTVFAFNRRLLVINLVFLYKLEQSSSQKRASNKTFLKEYIQFMGLH